MSASPTRSGVPPVGAVPSAEVRLGGHTGDGCSSRRCSDPADRKRSDAAQRQPDPMDRIDSRDHADKIKSWELSQPRQ